MTEQADSFLDLPPPLRKAAEVHGRAMVALVYNSGMATEAAQRLSVGARPPAIAAIRMIAHAFNETSSALAKAKGWAAADLQACEAAIELGFAQQRALVDSSGRVLS